MSDNAEFESLVGECRAQVAGQLPAIAARHSSLALLAALAEHVGGALRLFMESGQCTPEQARGVLQRCERTAFSPGANPSGAAPDR